MRAWSIKSCPTACSFGVKLLLLAGAMGVLSLAGLLEGPTQPVESQALSAGQAGASMGHQPQSPPVTVADVGHVDINRGSADDLRQLPGIGPVLAERVVRYRRENGKFATIRDIQRVKGIGVKRFAQLEPYIYVEPTTPSSGE